MEVKRKKRGRPTKEESGLEKSTIIETARDLTLKEGKVPSIRKLAGKLGVDPMAIYHYFSSKQILLEAVTASLIKDLYDFAPERHWKDNIMNLSLSYLSLLLDYPDLIEIILSGPNEGASAIFGERFERSLGELQLKQEQLTTLTHLLVDYIHGFAFAASCNKRGVQISIDMARGPLNYLFDRI